MMALHMILITTSCVSAFLGGGTHDNFRSATSQSTSRSINNLFLLLRTTPNQKHEIRSLRDGKDGYQTGAASIVGGKSNVYGHDYTLEENSNPSIPKDCPFTEDQIHALIAKRLSHKKAQNFADADRILKGLNMKGIYLQDKARKYRVDGENHFGRKQRYIQRGPSYGLAPDDLALIADMVEERARYKRMREYHVSDDITEKLKQQYGVKVNDKKREWYIVVTATSKPSDAAAEITKEDYYVPTPLAPAHHPTHTMDEKVKHIIRDRLRDRTMARKNKKYQEADRIRDELIETYSIVIDDRTKEWKVVDEYYDNDEDDLFVKEARMSQRSAFVARQQQQQGREEELHNVQYNSNDKFYRKNDYGNKDTDVDDQSHDDNDTNVDDQSHDDRDTDVVDDTESMAPSPVQTTNIQTELIPKVTNEASDDLATLTVVALKDKLREAGLPVSGKKAELIDRLKSSGIN